MKRITLIVLCHFLIQYTQAQKEVMVSQANHFISMLTPAQKSLTVLPFESEDRFSFHFFPIQNRKGISLNEMDAKQKQAAFSLLKTSLSAEAFRKTQEIISLESILKTLERRAPDDHYRDTGKYNFTIFGEPGIRNVWGWRFEGHHVVFNFSYKDNTLISGTPGFLGANPAIVREGTQKGKQVLKQEADLAFQLLKSLSVEQLREAAPEGSAPNDIISFNKRKPLIENNQGIFYHALNKSQQEKLNELIRLYVHRYTRLFAEQMMKDIKASGLDNIRFVWLGSREPDNGKAHYYKIQGPTLLIEYDNSQNNANHAHTVIRDLKNDFGEDVLSDHYKSKHGQAANDR